MEPRNFKGLFGLRHRDNFEFLSDSILKTIIMMSGEMEYEGIFYKENPPEGFGDDYDKGYEHVPFPFATYTGPDKIIAV